MSVVVVGRVAVEIQGTGGPKWERVARVQLSLNIYKERANRGRRHRRILTPPLLFGRLYFSNLIICGITDVKELKSDFLSHYCR